MNQKLNDTALVVLISDGFSHIQSRIGELRRRIGLGDDIVFTENQRSILKQLEKAIWNASASLDDLKRVSIKKAK